MAFVPTKNTRLSVTPTLREIFCTPYTSSNESVIRVPLYQLVNVAIVQLRYSKWNECFKKYSENIERNIATAVRCILDIEHHDQQVFDAIFVNIYIGFPDDVTFCSPINPDGGGANFSHPVSEIINQISSGGNVLIFAKSLDSFQVYQPAIHQRLPAHNDLSISTRPRFSSGDFRRRAYVANTSAADGIRTAREEVLLPLELLFHQVHDAKRDGLASANTRDRFE